MTITPNSYNGRDVRSVDETYYTKHDGTIICRKEITFMDGTRRVEESMVPDEENPPPEAFAEPDIDLTGPSAPPSTSDVPTQFPVAYATAINDDRPHYPQQSHPSGSIATVTIPPQSPSGNFATVTGPPRPPTQSMTVPVVQSGTVSNHHNHNNDCKNCCCATWIIAGGLCLFCCILPIVICVAVFASATQSMPQMHSN